MIRVRTHNISAFLVDGLTWSVIDYTKDDPLQVIPPRSVDFIFDTTGQAVAFLPLLVKGSGLVVSIATMPSGATLQNSSVMNGPDRPRLPIAARLFLDASDALRQLKARYYGVGYKFMFVNPNGKDLGLLGGYAEQGLLRPVVGARVDMRDLDRVREACAQTYRGKGALGKTVFDVVKDVNIGQV